MGVESMEDLYRIGVKLFCSNGADVALEEFIPIFHRWIQGREMKSLLIDVADYSHVSDGPGIMLVAFEGNYSIDEHGGRRGLAFNRKIAVGASLSERIESVARDAVAAASALEGDETLAGRFRLGGNEIAIVFNDRLLAPNTEDAFATVKPQVETFLERALGTRDYELTREGDPRARLSLVATAPSYCDLSALATRLGA